MVNFKNLYKYLKISCNYQKREYFDNSTLHGVPYIAEKGRPFREKFLWFCFTTAGVITTLIIISSLWEKFQTNPTITGLDTDFHSWKIDFPSVTICEQNSANPALIEALLENEGLNETSPEYEYLKSFYNTLASLTYSTIKTIKKFTNNPNLPQDNFQQILFNIVVHCEDTYFDCSLRSDSINCCSWPTGLFPVFTEYGLCYTFNSKNYLREWPWQKESLKDKKFQVYHVHETDKTWAYEFHYNHITNSSFRKIFLHTTEEVPGVDMSPHLEWEFIISELQFSVKETYTTPNAKQLSIRQRKCVFPNEIHIKTGGDVYTYYGCTKQCRIDLAIKICGCIPFFYLAIDNVKFCNLKGLGCLANNYQQILDPNKCNCELGCFNTVYEVEKFIEADGSTGVAIDRNETYTELKIEFASLPMIRYKREVIFGWVDLLVSFGGIAGLFLGFSLLSGVEIIYYFTIRTICMVHRNKYELKQYERENARVQIPNYDLSLVPYFIKPFEPGNGIKLLQQGTTKTYHSYQQGFYHSNLNKVQPINTTNNKPPPPSYSKVVWESRHPPFGVEYLP